MAKARTQAKAAEDVEPGSVDELTRIVVLALRYQGVPQGTLVHDLTDLGVPVGRIATLLKKPGNTISQQKRQKRPEWPPKKLPIP